MSIRVFFRRAFRSSVRTQLAFLPFTFAMLSGCGNRVLDEQIARLGPEDSGGPSENHRRGQPCLACHGPYEGAKPQMTIAGTIFAYPITKEITTAVKDDDICPPPVEGANIIVTDSFNSRNGSSPEARDEDVKPKKTNKSGNFYFTVEEFDPGFPLATRISCPQGTGEVGQLMASRISRAGSCADCHWGMRSQTSAGWVYCFDTKGTSPIKTTEKECPGVLR